MVLRPVDEAGDILPVLSSGDLLRGGPAAALLVRDRLELYAGEWWENPEQGNAVLEMLKENRYTETDRQALSSYLSSYIRETRDVLEVWDARCALEGRNFSFSCMVETEEGEAEIGYSM